MKILLFTKQDCPKCPQAKEVVKGISGVKQMDVVELDVDTGEGMYRVLEHGIISTPTILIEEEGTVHRFSGEISLEEVERVLK